MTGIFSSQRRGSAHENTNNSNISLQDTSNNNHNPVFKIGGAASALPLLLCGQLQRELMPQQHMTLPFFTQPNYFDSMNYHLFSTSSAYFAKLYL